MRLVQYIFLVLDHASFECNDVGLGAMQNEKTCLSQPYRIKFDFAYWLKPPPYGCFVKILMSGDYDANRMLLVLILLLLSLPPSVLPILLLISTTAAIIPVPIDDALAVAVAVVEIFVGKVDVVALVVADSEESVNQFSKRCRKTGGSNPKFFKSKIFRSYLGHSFRIIIISIIVI